LWGLHSNETLLLNWRRLISSFSLADELASLIWRPKLLSLLLKLSWDWVLYSILALRSLSSGSHSRLPQLILGSELTLLELTSNLILNTDWPCVLLELSSGLHLS
jgi:hypothetical protein